MSQEAPGRLETVRSYVNSVDLEDGTDELSSPDALVRWLGEHELLDDGEAATATAADLRRAVAVREALRDLLLAQHDDETLPPPDAVTTLKETARRSRVELCFRPDGSVTIEPCRPGVDGALGRLLGIVAEAQREGTWSRLKACPWDTCRWAFYDHSRNRSGVWCNMAVCGNRAKVKAFRERQTAAKPA